MNRGITTPLRMKSVRPDLTKDWPLPAYATEGSAGFDLRACIAEQLILQPGDREFIPCGFAFEVPKGHTMLLLPRSGMGVGGLILANGTGVIDSDYRAEVAVCLWNSSRYIQVVDPGDRICQALIIPVVQVGLILADELSDTARGLGGFGSTGTN